jgi:hypothetical protein
MRQPEENLDEDLASLQDWAPSHFHQNLRDFLARILSENGFDMVNRSSGPQGRQT